MKTCIFALILICILPLSSCKNSIKDFIDDSDYKYWYMQRGTDIVFYYFDNNGYWTIFEKKMFSSFRKHYSDEMLLEKWELRNDSTLWYNNLEHHILFISDTLMIIEDMYRKDTLREVPANAIPKKYQRKGPFDYQECKKNNFWIKPGTKPFYWDV